MRNHTITILGAAAGLGFSALSVAAEPFAAPGARGVLGVEYVFASAGSTADKYGSRDWKVSRTVTLQAELAAQAGAPAPTIAPIDPAIAADNSRRAERGAAVARDMQPMMAGVEKIVAKCGDDEACITRETAKLGFATEVTPKMQANRKEVAELSKAPPARYQRWQAQAQKGSYRIDESLKLVHADPICMQHPKQRCTRSETRKGAGDVPAPPATPKDSRAAAGFSAIEVDTVKNKFTVVLPLPLNMLPIEETIATDEPEKLKENGKRSTVLNPGLIGFKPIGQPITVALKGSARAQSGEQSFVMTDPSGVAGKLTVRWSFAAR